MNIGESRWADVVGGPRWSWADVSGIDPLELSFAGTPLDGEPINLAGNLKVGDRVWCQFNPGRGAAMQLLVLARGDERGWGLDTSGPFAPGWVTIAEFPGSGRASADFTLVNDESGDHEQLRFHVSVSYSAAAITFQSYNSYGRTSPIISGIRYLESGVYTEGRLQVRFAEDSTGRWSIRCDQPSMTALNRRFVPGSLIDDSSGFTEATRTGVAVSDWRGLALTNGWKAYGGIFAEPRYKMTPGGIIVMEGLVSGGTASVIANLPEGARPEKQQLFSPHMRYNTSYAAGRVDVKATGEVELEWPAATSTQWVSLSGLTFQAHN